MEQNNHLDQTRIFNIRRNLSLLHVGELLKELSSWNLLAASLGFTFSSPLIYFSEKTAQLRRQILSKIWIVFSFIINWITNVINYVTVGPNLMFQGLLYFRWRFTFYNFVWLREVHLGSCLQFDYFLKQPIGHHVCLGNSDFSPKQVGLRRNHEHFSIILSTNNPRNC